MSHKEILEFLADSTSARSTIDCWHDTVCSSVRLSVTLCIIAFNVGVGVEIYTVVFLAGHILCTSSDICCKVYRLALATKQSDQLRSKSRPQFQTVNKWILMLTTTVWSVATSYAVWSAITAYSNSWAACFFISSCRVLDIVSRNFGLYDFYNYFPCAQFVLHWLPFDSELRIFCCVI